MITMNQSVNRAFDMIGSPQDNGVSMANIIQDTNVAASLFKNAVRNYWTRNQVSADLVASQQDYQMPANFIRATEVTITANGIVYPLKQVSSEHIWNQLNIIPSVTIYIPTRYFVKGYNVISVWPAPSTANIGTLSVSFQPRIRDWSTNLADITGTASVTNASNIITDSATSFLPQMVGMDFTVTDGTGGNWYPIQAVPTNSTIDLTNYYIDQTNPTAKYLIGQVPDIPEDYQMALVYFPCYQFFLKRKDNETANNFYGLFQNLLDKYEDTYAVKTTGIVQTKQRGASYSVFGIPPTSLTG